MNLVAARVCFSGGGFVTVLAIDAFLTGRVIFAALGAAFVGFLISEGIYYLVKSMRP